MRCVCHVTCLVLVLALAASTACGSKVTSAPEPPPCEEACKDEIAMRSLRETAKLAFNLTLQGKPVGPHDETMPCPLGGSARVFGLATSNAVQGATEVKLTYVFAACKYLFKDNDPKENYEMTLTGTLSQDGIIAVQPSATTALVMRSTDIDFAGTVHDPPLPFTARCPIELGQNGNLLTGKICGRTTKTDL